MFGSALRTDFGPGSNIDLLATFAPDAEWRLLDQERMGQALEAMLGRKVDLLSRRAIERSSNWLRRAEILHSARTIYAAR